METCTLRNYKNHSYTLIIDHFHVYKRFSEEIVLEVTLSGE